jgi:hypothetical protein
MPTRSHQLRTLLYYPRILPWWIQAEGVGAETVEQLARRSLARMRHVLRAASVELLLLDSNADGQQPHQETYFLLGLGEDDQLTRTHTSQSTDWVQSKALHHGEPTLAGRSAHA